MNRNAQQKEVRWSNKNILHIWQLTMILEVCTDMSSNRRVDVYMYVIFFCSVALVCVFDSPLLLQQ